MKRLILLSLLAILASVTCGGLSADTWTAFSYGGGNPLTDGSPADMVFTLCSNHLSLNSSKITTIGNSSAMTWTLLFSGDWAACGTIDGSGDYIPDPYASFVQEGQGGDIQWANHTPVGYQAPLMLGRRFVGDGAATYTSRWGAPIGEVSASLVLNTHPSIWGSEYNLYEPVMHTFMATYPPVQAVPEPTGLLSLFAGGISLLGFRFKTLKNRK